MTRIEIKSFFGSNRNWCLVGIFFCAVALLTFDPKLADYPLSLQAQLSFWSSNTALAISVIIVLKAVIHIFGVERSKTL